MFFQRYAILALGLATALALACAREQEETGELSEELGIEETTTPGPAEVGLETVNASGVSGDLRVSHLDGQMEIALTVDGTTEGENYAAHLHRGECGNDLGVVTPIGEFTATAGENRISTTIDMASLEPSQSYFVQVHGADQAPVACAGLPAHAGMATTTP